MQSSVTKERWRYIGGSDCPAILGISPFVTRMEMLQYKAQIRENEFNGNAMTEYGNEMESKIRDYINDSRGYAFHEDKKILDDGTILPIRVHADGVDEEKETILEVKTTSRVFDDLKHYEAYISQMLLEMVVYDYRLGVLAVYERPADMDTEFDPERLSIYEIKFEDYHDLWERLEKAIRDFRYDLQFLKKNPLAEEEELPSRNSLIEVGNKRLQAGENAVKVIDLVTHKKEYKALLDEAEQIFLSEMEKRGFKSSVIDGAKITYVAKGEDTETMEFDKERFIKENPELAEKYMISKTRKGKKAYLKVTK